MKNKTYFLDGLAFGLETNVNPFVGAEMKQLPSDYEKTKTHARRRGYPRRKQASLASSFRTTKIQSWVDSQTLLTRKHSIPDLPSKNVFLKFTVPLSTLDTKTENYLLKLKPSEIERSRCVDTPRYNVLNITQIVVAKS